MRTFLIIEGIIWEEFEVRNGNDCYNVGILVFTRDGMSEGRRNEWRILITNNSIVVNK